ncbi:hypothetical protein [Streptomyces sp. NPDC086776]|jgi:hypothetical protein|uniref:hypothetical protein n=1 Tax=Streptomyces sp. NPDC086776 TaxID=3365756 RepID=UPI00088B5233|nr:hypothetical protein SAMN02745898_10351 [Streptomyces sp. 136MFCol5.1]
MYAVSLGGDDSELRPLEPWRAEEFLVHTDRGRESIGQHNARLEMTRDGVLWPSPSVPEGKARRGDPVGACPGVARAGNQTS